MCAARRDQGLSAVVKALGDAGIRFALVHESSLMGWGIDNNAYLDAIDAVLFDEDGFGALGAKIPCELGAYATTDIDGVLARLWSRSSLGLSGAVEVTSCARYGCDSLAPEIVLAKLPYSPDYGELLENRARLAAILHATELNNNELSLVASYVRGI